MKKRVRRSSWNRLRQSWCLAHNRKARCLAHLGPFGPAWRFSAGFGWTGWSAQSRQEGVHPASHLLRGARTLLVFPGTQLGLDQITCQDQVIVDDGHDMAPALKL